MDIVQWDAANQKIKVNPLADWSLDDVHKYIKENKVDVNPLHAEGFVSIGCAPCTRPNTDPADEPDCNVTTVPAV